MNFNTSIFLFIGIISNAQVKIGDNIDEINPNSLIELESSNRGLVLSRLALISTVNPSPMTENVVGMFVYNTPNYGNVFPGI